MEDRSYRQWPISRKLAAACGAFLRNVPDPENRARHSAEMGRQSRPFKAEAHYDFQRKQRFI
jgi:hypothetical protein